MSELLEHNVYEHCYECGDPLKKVRHLRTSPKICTECRGTRQSNDSTIREVYIELKKMPKLDADPRELVFVDHPDAIWEHELPYRRERR